MSTRDVESILASKLLRMAADEFSNHGCNDFDLVKDAKLTPAESFAFRKAASEWNGDAAEDPARETEHGMSDWFAMSYLAEVLKKRGRS